MQLDTITGSVQITNSSTESVLIISGYNPKSGVNAGTEQVYEQTLTLLETTEGQSTIAGNGTEATVNLSGTDSKGQPRTLWDIILARPVDLFPVQNVLTSQDLTDDNYPPIKITEDDATNVKLAMQFQINILAYPTSTLAQNYQQAMTNAEANATSVDQYNSIMDSFFQNDTKQYTTVTMNDVVSVATYMEQFAFVWAGSGDNFATFNDTITYYLYSAGTPGNNSVTANPVNEGTLTLTKNSNAPNPASLTDYNGGYTITYTDSSNNQTVIYYQDGVFVSDKTLDIPPIALKGSFAPKNQFTNDPSDSQTIIPVIVGVINGTQILGATVKQDTGDGSGGAKWYAFLHPTSFNGWIQLFLELFGVGYAIYVIVKLFMLAYSTWKGSPDSDPKEVQDEMNEARPEMEEDKQSELNKVSNDNDDIKVPDSNDMTTAITNARNGMSDQLELQRSQVVQDELIVQDEQVTLLGQYGVDDQLEIVAGNIRSDFQNIDSGQNELINNAEPADLKNAVDTANTNIPENTTTINQVTQNLEEEDRDKVENQINDSNQEIQDLDNVQDNIDDNQEDVQNGEGGDDDADIDF